VRLHKKNKQFKLFLAIRSENCTKVTSTYSGCNVEDFCFQARSS